MTVSGQEALTRRDWRLPMVEIFQTVEGEGTKAGFPTTFVRVYNCNLRCSWCDTTYSYAPNKPEFYATIGDIAQQVETFGNRYVCLTGGEPLMHGEKSLALVEELSRVTCVQDVHIETNGAIYLGPFAEWRRKHPDLGQKVRFVMDWKLPASGETDKMIAQNLSILERQDELKFVIGDDEDFRVACEVLERHQPEAQALFSPVWETMPPARLVEKVLAAGLKDVKINMQLHKIIWHPDTRGV